MPKAPTPACRQPGCPRDAVRAGLCVEHAVKQGKAEYVRKGSKAERGYPANWEKLRRVVLQRDPVCKGCELEVSTEVDHIMPLERGGKNELTNLQGLDKTCHSRKTAFEQRIKDPIEVMRRVRVEGRRGRVADDAAVAGG